MNNCFGQASLEYLLIIGGALVVASIALVVVLDLGPTSAGSAERSFATGECGKFGVLTCDSRTVAVGENDYPCRFDVAANHCVPVFDTECIPGLCDGYCPPNCAYEDDLDCGSDCYDSCMNGNETGIDCGGSCESC